MGFVKGAVVLFSGKAGTGKSTSAKICKNYVENLGYDSRICSFASGVKQVSASCFGWDGKKDTKGRKLLQDVGQTGRNYYEDIWVSKVFGEYLPVDFTFVDDWRFPNEWSYIKNQGLYAVYAVRLVAPTREILRGTPQYNDISETALDMYEDKVFDFVLDNSIEMEWHIRNLTKMLDTIIERQVKF